MILIKKDIDTQPTGRYYDLDKKGYRYATNWEVL